MLRWKDLNRVSDRSYAKARASASKAFPPTKHLKQHEKQVNHQLPTIHQVLHNMVAAMTVMMVVEVAMTVEVVGAVQYGSEQPDAETSNH